MASSKAPATGDWPGGGDWGCSGGRAWSAPRDGEKISQAGSRREQTNERASRRQSLANELATISALKLDQGSRSAEGFELGSPGSVAIAAITRPSPIMYVGATHPSGRPGWRNERRETKGQQVLPQVGRACGLPLGRLRLSASGLGWGRRAGGQAGSARCLLVGFHWVVLGEWAGGLCCNKARPKSPQIPQAIWSFQPALITRPKTGLAGRVHKHGPAQSEARDGAAHLGDSNDPLLPQVSGFS